MKNKASDNTKKLMDKTSRLNIYLDPVVVKAAKIQANRESVPVNKLIEKLLKDGIPPKTMALASDATESVMKPNSKPINLTK